MQNTNKLILPERNPVTHARHRREVFYQITLPLLIGLLLLIVFFVFILLTVTQGGSTLQRWADVSLIWLIIPALFFTLIILVMMGAFIYLITFLLRLIPGYAHIGQMYLEMVKTRVGKITDLIVEPFLRTRSGWAVLRQAGKLGRHPLDED
jgi:hypothetical protein